MMDKLSRSQKVHLKSTYDLQTENITKLQSGIDACLRSLLEIMSEEEGMDGDGQQALDDWTSSLVEEKEDAFEKANNIILDLVSMASPMLPEEEPRNTGAVHSTKG